MQRTHRNLRFHHLPALILCVLLLSALAVPSAMGQDVRTSMEEARDLYSTTLEELRALMAQREGAARDADLLYGLNTVIELEDSVLASLMQFGRRTLGKPLSRLTDEERKTLEQLTADQGSAAARFEQWWEDFDARYAADPTVSLSRVYDQLVKTRTPERLAEAAGELEGNHLPQAAELLQHSLENLRLAQRFLEEALGRSRADLERRVAQLKQLIANQEEVYGETRDSRDNNTEAQRADLHERQLNIRRIAESLADSFDALAPAAGPSMRTSLPLMETSGQSLRRGRFDASIDAQRQILAHLEMALEAAEDALLETGSGDSEGLAAGVPLMKQNAQRRAMQILMAGGGGGANALSEIMNDLNALRDIRDEQLALRGAAHNTRAEAAGNDDSGGAGKTAPTETAEDQAALSATTFTLAGRVLDYEPGASDLIITAAERMESAATDLAEGDAPAAVAEQDEALVSLDEAEARIEAFWELLLEAMMNLMEEGEAGMAMGGGAESGDEMSDLRRQEIMAMLNAMIRMHRLKTSQTALAERVASASNGEVELRPPDIAREQTALAKEALAISNIELLDPHVAGALKGIWSLMTGARIQIDIGFWTSAWEHQQQAIDGIRIVAGQSNTALAQMQTQSAADVEGADLSAASEGGGGGGASMGAAGENWEWQLPERERQIIQQSLSEPLPAEHEELIRAYFRSLAEGSN